MRLLKLAEHLSKDTVKLRVAFCSGGAGSVLLAHFVPIDSAVGRIEMLVFHGAPDYIEGFLAHFG